MAFPKFPYTDFHRLNADWILEKLRVLWAAITQKAEEADAAVETVEGYNTRLTAAEGDIDNLEADVGSLENSRVSYAASQQLNDTQKATARDNIGAVSAADIPSVTDAVRVVAQTFSTPQKAQARANIEAASSAQLNTLDGRVQTLESNAVRVTSQSFTAEQKTQARTNIGAAASSAIPDVSDVVRYSSQSLTDGQKTQARTNIGAAASSAIPDVSDVVRYSSQSLTDGQKTQARTNIAAADVGVVEELEMVAPFNVYITETSSNVFTCEQSLDDILLAVNHDAPIIVNLKPYGGSSDLNYRGLAYFPSADAGGYTGPVVCDLFSENDPALNANSIAYHVYLASVGGLDSLTVTKYNYRTLPATSASDVGKVPIVNNLGTPVWTEVGPIRTTVSGATPTITPADNHIYICGTVTDLTIDTFPATGMWSIIFVSGATKTSTDFPVTLNGLDDFVPEANTRYEINVLDGWAVVGSWAVSA